jgi:hypothetical protein
MIHLTPVLLNGLSAFNEDPVSLPPILAFVQVLGWLPSASTSATCLR